MGCGNCCNTSGYKEQNLDWLMEELKKAIEQWTEVDADFKELQKDWDDWQETREGEYKSFTEAIDSAFEAYKNTTDKSINDFKTSMTQEFANFQQEFTDKYNAFEEQMTTFVQNYLDNNVKSDVNARIQEMIDSGDFTDELNNIAGGKDLTAFFPVVATLDDVNFFIEFSMINYINDFSSAVTATFLGGPGGYVTVSGVRTDLVSFDFKSISIPSGATFTFEHVRGVAFSQGGIVRPQSIRWARRYLTVGSSRLLTLIYVRASSYRTPLLFYNFEEQGSYNAGSSITASGTLPTTSWRRNLLCVGLNNEIAWVTLSSNNGTLAATISGTISNPRGSGCIMPM